MLCDLGQISSPFCVSVPATYNLGGSLQWSGGQPAQRPCHLSDIARSLPHAVACSPFCCSSDGWNMCDAWDVLEAGRPKGELAAPSHLDTLQGSQDREAEFLSPALWTCLIYSPAAKSRQLARSCVHGWGNPTQWLVSPLSALIRLEGRRQDR